jgi:cAMP-dependent protein kinase regulator
METDPRSRVLEAFKEFDSKGAKTIEFEQLLRIFQALIPCYSEYDFESALSATGNLKNGIVVYEDFINWLFEPAGAGRTGSLGRNGSKEAAAAREAEKIASQPKTRRPGTFNERIDKSTVENYVKPVYPKDSASKALIMKTLRENEKLQVLCGHLEDKDFEDLINAFQLFEFSNDTEIIRQGDKGDRLYIIEFGQVDVYVARPGANGKLPEHRGTKVVSYEPGALFGELALLYSAPRAATVCAACDRVKVWGLNQLDFKMLLAQSSQQKLSMYDGWLRQVDIFGSLNYYELSRLSELLETTLFDEGENIIKQGDAGDTFFLLEDGHCAAFIEGSEGEKEVKRYERQGDYFGELALLTSAPRKATVRAVEGGCIVASLSRDVFADILGPLADMLRERGSGYAKYEDVLL